MKDRINKDYLEAFKSGDTDKKNFLGLIKGEIQTEEKRGNGEVDVMAILKKMEKSLKTTNDAEAQKQLVILQEYLPVLMSEDEIEIVLLNIRRDEGINTLPQLMSSFNRDFKGKADNQLVMKVIKQIL